MEDFFGFGGYKRTPEGYMSWQHLTFVFSMIAAMIVLAIVLGIKNKNKPQKEKNVPIIVAAIAIDAFEIFKIVVMCLKDGSLSPVLRALPLFLCSIQLIALPVAAFSKGRAKEFALDFVFIFGLLGAILGTVGAGQNYSCYPVLSIDNVVSAITHCISGFGCLYIGISGMRSMKQSNIKAEMIIFVVFCAVAYVADVLIPYNYMFLIRGDGTPYDIFYNIVGGSPVLYPVSVVGTLIVYMLLFFFIDKKISARKTKKQ